MATQVTIKLEHECSIPLAISVLHTHMSSHTEYARILQQILATGYDINANKSELLLFALSGNGDINNITLLFSLGAQVATAHEVYDRPCGHAFNAGRVYKPSVAKALFDHVMASPHFDVISKHLHENHQRIDVFNDLASDEDKAALYVRARLLPRVKCNENTQRLCALSGLSYPPRTLSLSEKLTAATAETTSLKEQLAADAARFEEQLADVTAKLAETTAKLEKATGIIAKLTSIC